MRRAAVALLPGLFSTPTLLVLHHVRDGQAINLPISTQTGTQAAPTPLVSAGSWTIEPGSTRSTLHADHEVKLYAEDRNGAALLCEISVRYFPVDGAYIPYYRLNERMYFVRKDGHWVPITLVDGLPSLVTFTPTGFANAAGYYPEITMSKSTGPITVAGWKVARLPTP